MNNDNNYFIPIPLNYDSGKGLYFGISLANWICIAIPAVLFAIIGYSLTTLLGFPAIYGLAVGTSLFILIAAVLVIITLRSGNPLKGISATISFLLSRRKLEYRYIKRHKRTKADVSKIITKSEETKYDNDDSKEEDGSGKLIRKDLIKESLSDFSGIFEVSGKKQGTYYTQQACPAESIHYEDGMYFYKLTDGSLVHVLEIQGVNLQAEDDSVRMQVLSNFKNFLQFYDGGMVQIKVRTEAPDMTVYTNNLREVSSRDPIPRIGDLGNEIADFLEEQGENLKVNRYFVIASSKGTKAILNLKEFHRIVESYLANNGIIIKTHDDEKEFLREFLFSYYNHPELQPKLADYETRKKKVYEMTRAAGNYGEPNLRNFVCPLGLDYTSSEYVYSSGQFHQTVFLENIPRNPAPDWLGYFILYSDPVFELDMFINKKKNNDQLKMNIGSKVASYGSVHPLGQNDQLQMVKEDAQYIKANINSNQFLEFAVAITIHANTLEDLRRFVKFIDERVRQYLDPCETNKCRFLQEAAYRSCVPLCIPDKSLFKKFKRNILSSGLLYLNPIMTTSTMGDHGVVFGSNYGDNSPVLIDLFRPMTAHTMVVGGSGGGKTFSTMMQLTRCRLDGTQIIILCPVKGVEYKLLAESLGGEYIPIGSAYKTRINVLAITPEEKTDEEDFSEAKSLLQRKVADLTTFFDLAFPEMSSLQRDQISSSLMSFYAKFGITTDNNSIYNPDGSLKTMPLLEDFQKHIREDEILAPLAPQLNKFISGHLGFFNAQTNKDLSNKFIVFDLTDALEARKEDMSLLVNLVTTLISQRVKGNRQRKIVVFEEAWNFKSQPEIFAIIEEFFRTARFYNAACYCVSQAFDDFGSCPGLLQCTQNYIFFKNENREDLEHAIKKIDTLNPNDVDLIPTFERGDAIIARIEEKRRIRTHFDACETEKWLYETNPEKRKSAQRLAERR